MKGFSFGFLVAVTRTVIRPTVSSLSMSDAGFSSIAFEGKGAREKEEWGGW